MTIVRQQSSDGSYELTLINTIRLDDKTLAQLSMLGEIKHVVRLGAFHRVDDAFYLQRNPTKCWIIEGYDKRTWSQSRIRNLKEPLIKSKRYLLFSKRLARGAINILGMLI